MSCENCGETDKDLYEQRLQVIENAKKYANDNSVEVAIYQLPGNKFAFIRADIAQRDSIPVIRYISFVPSTTDGKLHEVPL